MKTLFSSIYIYASRCNILVLIIIVDHFFFLLVVVRLRRCTSVRANNKNNKLKLKMERDMAQRVRA